MNSQFCNAASPPVFPFTALKPACNTYAGGQAAAIWSFATVQDVTRQVDSYAAYAQANFHFTDQIFATLGGATARTRRKGRTTRPTNAAPFMARATSALRRR